MLMPIEEIIERVREICRQYHVKSAILYGSWAKGTATERSDVDVAIIGASDFEELKEAIMEIPTLRSFDILDYDRCRNVLLIKEIEEYGRKIL